MTCLEKYKMEHGGEEPDVNIFCPHISGGIAIDEPDYCPAVNGRPKCVVCWNRQIPGTEPTVKPDPQSTETVNHPKHYGREGAMECIDEMVLVFGAEATMNFCLLNAWKYRYRAGAKGGDEDLKKSDWYLTKYAELKGGD